MTDPKIKKMPVPQLERRPYRSPRLILYGAAAKLTASGSRGSTEAGMSANNPSKRP